MNPEDMTREQLLDIVRNLPLEQRLPKRFPIHTERDARPHPLGIPWQMAERAYSVYAASYGKVQSLERLAERGGFGPSEMDKLLPSWREELDTTTLMHGRIVELEAWEADAVKEVKDVIDNIPMHCRVSVEEGGGPCSLIASLVVSVAKLTKEYQTLVFEGSKEKKPTTPPDTKDLPPYGGVWEATRDSLMQVVAEVHALVKPWTVMTFVEGGVRNYWRLRDNTVQCYREVKPEDGWVDISLKTLIASTTSRQPVEVVDAMEKFKILMLPEKPSEGWPT
jgi:hypothetical protein